MNNDPTRPHSDSWRQIVLENALDAVIGVDFDDVVIDWNRQAELTFGWSREDILGKQMAELIIPEEMRARHRAGMKRFRETGIGPILNKRIEIIAAHRNGAIFPVELTVVPVPVDGTFVFYSFLRDISERKKIEKQLQQAKEDAERTAQTAGQLNQLKDDFLASLSHEIRTPLNAISGFAELLALDLPEATGWVKDSLDAIQRNSSSLTNMITDLLDVSKIESGKISFQPTPTATSEILDVVVANTKQSARDAGLTFVSDLDDAPETLFVDPTRLQQIVWNLLSNAMKFTPRGGAIELRVHEEDDCCVIEVSDTGHGIDREFLPHVFDRFRQENAAITRSHGGLGLGLAITHHLVELHGGKITAESKGKGHGSRFIVKIPLYKGVATEADATTASKLPEPSFDQSVMKGLKIHVVDDSPDSLQLIARMLGRSGAKVTISESVAAAFAKITSDPPELVISDIGMPGESGFDLIAKIRSHSDPRVSSVRAIATTAYVRSEERQKILHAGFDAHVSKPISNQTLTLTIGKTLAQKS